MSKSKHSPRPWKYELYMGTSSYRIVSDESSTVCWNIATKADAQLIEAAPNLLFVLKDIRDFLQRSGYDRQIIDTAIRQATEATIAEAEGV